MKRYQGSCLCGGIRFEVLGEIKGILNCHCSDCRKAHGAAFRTRGAVEPCNFQFLAGENLLTRYEHKPGEFRSFCRVCGSNIATFFSDPSIPIGIVIALIDTKLEVGSINARIRFRQSRMASYLRRFTPIPGIGR